MQLPYNGNRPRKKSFANCLLCRSSRENFRDSGNLIYKNSGRDKKCKKTFAIASRFAKFAKLFFHGWFLLYGNSSGTSFQQFFNHDITLHYLKCIYKLSSNTEITKYEIYYNLIEAPYIITNYFYGQSPYNTVTEP